jgi:hypothetical protein
MRYCSLAAMVYPFGYNAYRGANRPRGHADSRCRDNRELDSDVLVINVVNSQKQAVILASISRCMISRAARIQMSIPGISATANPGRPTSSEGSERESCRESWRTVNGADLRWIEVRVCSMMNGRFRRCADYPSGPRHRLYSYIENLADCVKTQMRSRITKYQESHRTLSELLLADSCELRSRIA